MIAPVKTRTNDQESDAAKINKRFLQMLPAIERYGRFAFRYLPVEACEEAVAETVANCFVAFARLVERRKEEQAHAVTLARYAAAQIRFGRRVGTSFSSRDVYSQRHRYEIQRMGTPRDQRAEWQEQLVDNRRTPIPDQVAFRCDFPSWLASLPRRDRRLALALVRGSRTTDVAREFKLSAGRVSQVRRELHASWNAFHGDE